MPLDLDQALRRLASQPVHPGLAGLETAVLSRIANDARHAVSSSMPLVAAAAFVAAAMGVASVGMPLRAAEAAPALSPFGPSTPLAPSTLLAGIR